MSKSHLETKEQFLIQVANEYRFFKVTREVFMARFAENNASASNKEIAKNLKRKEYELSKYLGDICSKLGFGSNTPGRKLKGTSPWEKAYRWLWNEKYNELTKSELITANVQTEVKIDDWYSVCEKILEKQQETQRLRHKATSMGFEVNIDIPLGLVERKEQQRLFSKESSHNYEPPKEVITKIYENQEFLEQVIGKEASGKNKHAAIVGEPGAGKTTLLVKIADFIKSQNQDLAIYISLARLEKLTLQDYLLKKWLPEAMGLFNPEITDTSAYEGELIKRFRKGGVWLLLDAVDEMGENSPTVALTKLEKELKEDWLTEVRVILTCRLNVWDININCPLTCFDTYKTQEFKPEEIDKFITDWFTNAEKPHLGETLQKKLKESKHQRIHQLVKNPLRLSLLCQIFYRDENGDLPATKAGLYERYVRYFYEWKPKNIPVDLIKSDDLKDELHQALGKLALAGIDSNYKFQLPRSLCREHMNEKLFNLALDVGWLVLAGRTETDEEIFVFWHQNFQEYFASLAIDDWHYFLNHVPDNPDKGNYRIFETQWKEVFLLWLGRSDISNDSKDKPIVFLFNFEDGCNNFFRKKFLYDLCSDCINEFWSTSINEITYIDYENNDFSSIFVDKWMENQDYIYPKASGNYPICEIRKSKDRNIGVWMHQEKFIYHPLHILNFEKHEYHKNEKHIKKLNVQYKENLERINKLQNVDILFTLTSSYQIPFIRGAAIKSIQKKLADNVHLIPTIISNLSKNDDVIKYSIIEIILRIKYQDLDTVEKSFIC